MSKPVITLAVLAVAGAALLLPLSRLRADAALAQPAPDFTLQDIAGKSRALKEFRGKFVVLEWTNYDCPFVKKHYSGGNMQALQKSYTGKGVVWLSINTSAPGKQGSYPAAEWAAKAKERGAASTAILLDPDGTVGRAYAAKTTPHMFIINPEGKLIYAGAIDDKPTADAADIATSKNYVKAALDEALAGKPVTVATSKAYGCSVKY